MQFHRSAFKHGFDEEAISHVVEHALVVVDLDPDSDPPKMLAIGPDPGGRPAEIIWLELAENALVIHAMDLRPIFHQLLPAPEDPTS